MSISSAIKIVNAALTRTGNSPITDFYDGSTEATVAANNYDLLVEEEICSYPYSWAKTDNGLNRLAETPIDEWAYVHQIPEECIRLVRCHVNGISVPYKRKDSRVYSNEENLTAEYMFRAEEEDWSPDFRGRIISKLEAVFLRALSEDYDKAEFLEKHASDKDRMVKSQDSQNRSPKDRRPTSRLVACRRA